MFTFISQTGVGCNEGRSGTYQVLPAAPVSLKSRTLALLTWRVWDSVPPTDSGGGWTQVLIPPLLLG